MLKQVCILSVLVDISVFVICAYGRDIIYTICAAENADMLNGQFVFIAIDFAFMTKSRPENRPCSLSKDLEGKKEDAFFNIALRNVILLCFGMY